MLHIVITKNLNKHRSENNNKINFSYTSKNSPYCYEYIACTTFNSI